MTIVASRKLVLRTLSCSKWATTSQSKKDSINYIILSLVNNVNNDNHFNYNRKEKINGRYIKTLNLIDFLNNL